MIPAQAKSNSDFVIFLQAGHSPSAKTSGASVTYDGKTIREDDLNEKLTYYTYQKLTAAGYTVYLTNPITLYPNLPSVIQTPCPSNRSQYDLDVILDAIHNPSKYNSKITSQPDLVLSLHHNSSGDGTVSASNPSGCITFYTNWVGNRDGVGKYERNQESVQRSYDFANILNSSFQQSSYPSKSSVQLNNSNNHLTKYSRVPTILLEAGFMTNTNDLTAVQKDSNMSIMADRITSAVNSYAAKYPNSIPPYSSEKDPPTATWFQPDETTNSKFIAQVGGVTDKSGVKSVLFEVWNCSAGYGSAKQYAGVNTASGVWDATVDISKFGNKYGMYGVNIYGTDVHGNTGCMMTKYVNVIGDTTAPTATWFQPDETTNSKFIAQVGGVTDKSGVKSVLFEVWNCSAGYGSAKQYAGVNTASGVWDATVDISKFGNKYGMYGVNIYGTDNKGNTGCMMTKYVNVIGDTTAPTATWFQPDETTNSKFIAQVGGVTDKSGVKSVLFEVWNCSAGYGSAKQYAGVNTASGVWDATVDISKFGNKYGMYGVNIYGTDNKGNTGCMMTKYVNVIGDTTAPTATWFQPDETTNSKFIAQVGGVTDKSGVKSVLFEVWNCSAGYGSAKQYAGVNTASGVWDATVDISKFGNKYGMYGVNIYGTDNKGNTGCIMTRYIKIGDTEAPTATWFQPDETTNSKFIAQVGGVTDKSGVKSVLFEVWNCSAGYGSAKQYAGVNTASGVWDATVDISKFDNKYGMYGVNIYGTDNKGNTGCMMTKYVNVIYDSSLSYTIMGDSGTTVNQMINYYLNSGKTYPQYYIDRNVDLAQFCQIYYEEAKAEGVKVDVAFAQMIYETGWLQFGGIVPVEYFNFAGLGAFDNNSTGQCANFAEKFGDNATGIRMGIRAQIQHLKCYASSASLVNSCVDPRWDAVVNIYGRGSAPTLGQLSAKWATNTSYGYSIMKLINSLNSMSNTLSANTLSLFAPPEAAPSTSPEAAPSTSPEAAPSTSPEAAPSTSPDAAPSTSPEAAPSTSPEAAPSVSPEAE
nr:GBS Bsp-like repeat-containing protein [Christensenella minuta]